MTSLKPQHPPRFGAIDPVLVGAALGLVASVLYTFTNIYLRKAGHCDPFLVSCIKAVPTASAAALFVGVRLLRGRATFPGWRLVGSLLATGLFVQFVGNTAFQFALGVVGVALTVPLTLGTLIIGGALLARVQLLEGITPRSAIAMLLLVISIVVLSLGAESAHRAIVPADGIHPHPWLLAMGVGAACMSGIAYAWLGLVMRRMVRSDTPLEVTFLIIGLTGVVSLGLASVARLGFDGMLATDPIDLGNMLLAGAFNVVGFYALSNALRLASVVQVNAVNASQTALAAIAGIVYFDEPFTLSLAVGVALTCAGLLLVDRRQPIVAQREAEPSAESVVETVT